MPTTARVGYRATTRPSSASMCRTYGQWLQRNATSSAGAAAKSSRCTLVPDRSSSVKLDAGVPNGTMSDRSAITSAYKCAQALLSSPTVQHTSQYVGPVGHDAVDTEAQQPSHGRFVVDRPDIDAEATVVRLAYEP